MCSSNATFELSMHVLWRHNFLQHHTCFSVTHYVDVGKGKSSQSEQHGYKVQTTEQLVHTTKILRTGSHCRKYFWLLQNLAGAHKPQGRIEPLHKGKAAIHTVSKRFKYHLNSCSDPKQLAKLSSQRSSMGTPAVWNHASGPRNSCSWCTKWWASIVAHTVVAAELTVQ